MTASFNGEIPLFPDFHPGSKVWIYSSDRRFTEEESKRIEALLSEFAKNWTAHDQALKAAGSVLYHQFIVLSVDESQAHASGCSIDKSVHFIKTLEQQFQIRLFDRLKVYYLFKDELMSMPLDQLEGEIANRNFDSETLIFDCTLTRLEEVRKGFIKSAGASWLRRYF